MTLKIYNAECHIITDQFHCGKELNIAMRDQDEAGQLKYLSHK